MVEKATVNRSSRFKAELEISIFTSMKMNKSDCSCLCFTNIKNKSDIIQWNSHNFTSDNRTHRVTSPLSDGPGFFSYILLLS